MTTTHIPSVTVTTQASVYFDGKCISHGITFADLYSRDGLIVVDAAFQRALGAADEELAQRLVSSRTNPGDVTKKDESALILEMGPHLDRFIATLFDIDAAVDALTERHVELAPLYMVKRQFVQRRAVAAYKADEAVTFDGLAIEFELSVMFGERFSELAFARHIESWLKDEAAN